MKTTNWTFTAGLVPATWICLLILTGCDTRKPVEGDELVRPPILELRADNTIIRAARDTTVAVTAYLLNAFRGTLSGRPVTFTAQRGFISSLKTTDEEGQALAYYHSGVHNAKEPIQDTVRAFFQYEGPDGKTAVSTFLVITLLPDEQVVSDVVGSLELATSRSAVQIRGTGNNDQAVLSARVFDIFKNKARDGTKVRFEILSGPGGGENLNQRGRVDTAATLGGVATVTLNSGTRIGVVEILVQSQEVSSRQSLLTITSGPPHTIDLVVQKDSGQISGSRWKVQVHAVLTDIFLNPVKDSVSVLFSLNTEKTDPGAVSIEGSGVTGTRICEDCPPVPGTAITSLYYRSQSIFDTLEIFAETVTDNRRITGSYSFQLPLQATRLNAYYYGGPVKTNSFAVPGTAEIIGMIKDGMGIPTPGAMICISSDAGNIREKCKASDDVGKVTFNVDVTKSDQLTVAPPSRTVSVVLTEQSTGIAGRTEFTAIFQ